MHTFPPQNAERSRGTRWFELDDEPYQAIPDLYECRFPKAEKNATPATPTAAGESVESVESK